MGMSDGPYQPTNYATSEVISGFVFSPFFGTPTIMSLCFLLFGMGRRTGLCTLLGKTIAHSQLTRPRVYISMNNGFECFNSMCVCF